MFLLHCSIFRGSHPTPLHQPLFRRTVAECPAALENSLITMAPAMIGLVTFRDTGDWQAG